MRISDTASGETFEIERDLIDATSISRPDTRWRYTDANGHLHAWYVKGETAPAAQYSPSASYDLPTLLWVVDGVAYYPDGESYEYGHYECVQCGEHVKPANTADTETQYIAGLLHCRINGTSVSKEEFDRRARAAGLLK
jgi:hypothetical protein